MKDPSDKIRAYIFGLLDGNVSYGGNTIEVYSFAPKNEAMPYILLGEHYIISEAQSTKDAYLTENEMTIEVWTSFTGNDASYVPANTIADSVLQLLRLRTLTQGVTGFNVIKLTLTSGASERFEFENKIVILKSLIINLLLEES